MSESRWQPERQLEIAAGTPPGGGLDRVARAVADVIKEARLVDVPVSVRNIPGDGARRVWATVDQHAGDAHLVSISSPNLTSDRLVGLAAFDHRDYSPIATLVTEYIAFAVPVGSPLLSGDDLVARLQRDAGGVTVALSTALGNPNHIAFAKLVRHAGSDINASRIRVFDTALDAVADVAAGNADVGAVTAASTVSALNAGMLRLLAISAPARLAAPFADTPTWVEQSVDCVVGAWRGVTGPAGIGPAQIAFWEDLLAAVIGHDKWKQALAAYCWSDMFLTGPALHAHLTRERIEMRTILAELGLLRDFTEAG